MKEYRLTREGYNRLIAEREGLINNKRKEIAERLKEAKENAGDLAENTEYEDAKNEQAFTEGRIEQISEILGNYVLVEENNNKDIIDLGSTVQLRDLDSSEKKKFMIVSSVESDPENNKISDESPLGRALLGKKAGDEVEAKIPGKIIKLKVLKVS
jgi:transcription elongation factor GreA